jgi:hypothetical protein
LSRPEHPALVAAARWGLARPRGVPVITADDLPRVAAVAGTDRLGGLLFQAVMDGSIHASASAVDTIRRIWNDQLLSSVLVEAQVLRTAEVLEQAGVGWRLTKGAALAHLDYADPALRPFGDVDIIVRRRDWDAALAAFSASGWRRLRPELRAGYDRRFGKGATLKTPEGLEVDAHLRFAVGRFGIRSRMEDLFSSADSIVLAGQDVSTLDAVGRFLHACHHAALGGNRHLRAYRDVAQLLLVTHADWARAVEIAKSWRVEAVLGHAITETWAALDLEDAHPALDWAAALRISRRDRRALSVFAEERPFRDQALTTVTALPPWQIPGYLASVHSKGVAKRFFSGRRRQ